MDDSEFDRAMIAAAFVMAAERGWQRMNVAQVARQAGLDLGRARLRFPHRGVVLLRFGREADRQALAAATPGAPVRDQLFDMLMRRIDALQAHPAGVLALFRALPVQPAAALLWGAASLCSMGWLLGAAGVPVAGPVGKLRMKGLLAVWLWTVRAWRNDDSVDLAATMAALDQALGRAEAAEAWLRPRRPAARAPAAEDEAVQDTAGDDEPPPEDPFAPETPSHPPTA